MKKTNLFQIIGAVLILALIFSNDYLKSIKLKKEHNYTVGKVYDFTKDNRSGVDLLFRFDVEGEAFEGKILSPYSKAEQTRILNKQFLVIFYPKNPKINSILLDKPIKNNLQSPPEGWSELPKIQ
jgi:hypothetical protein